MKVALITPEWRFKNPYPPLGLAYIGAVLEKEHNVRIFDLTLDHVPFDDNIRYITKFSPDIVGISCMSHNYHEALKVAKCLKSNIGVPIVFGGPHPTIMPEEVLKNDSVDFVIMGEGEYTFLRLCQNYQSKDFKGIDGLCFKSDNGKEKDIIIQPKTKFIENLDDIPFPARHLLKLDNYTLEDHHGNKMITIMSSRGCPYGCTYCYKGLFGRTYRQRSSQNIIDEIKCCIDEFGYTSFYFIDDLFTLNSKRVEEFANAIKREHIDIRWQCLARVDNATPQMFKQMKESGCYNIHFGIESGNQDVVDRVKKGIKLDQVRNAVKCAKEANIETKGYFMLGMPGDTVSTMNDTLNFAKKLGLNDIMFGITTPFPGTELWNSIDKNKISSLSNAFYCINNHEGDIDIFYNLSDATDDDVISAMKRANDMREDIKIKFFCNSILGKKIGSFTWRLSKVPPMRYIRKKLIKI